MMGSRSRLLALARAYPWTTRLVWGIALLFVAGDLWLLAKRVAYAAETQRLRAGMSVTDRSRLDAAMKSNENRTRVMIELARRQARGDNGLHLAVSVDSGMLYLEQEGAVLRTVRADIGAGSWIHVSRRDSLRVGAPRGTRTIERLLGDTTLVLNGGTVIYARAAGDSGSAVRPGGVRVEAKDLKALGPNLRVGQRVYFY